MSDILCGTVGAASDRHAENVVRKSQGFSWGAAGLSTSLYTGPMLADLINRARPMRRARFVWMEGADELVSGAPCTFPGAAAC